MLFDNLGAKVKRNKLVTSNKLNTLHYEKIKRVFFTNAELYAAKGDTLIFDVECYPNYFCVNFLSISTDKVFKLEITESGITEYFSEILFYILTSFTLIGFNSKSYDLVMCAKALTIHDTSELCKISNIIIGGEDREILKHGLFYVDHIDIIDVCPLQGSLKLYSGRLFAKRMQDLPIAPNSYLTNDEITLTNDYCFNDCENTKLLTYELREQINLRYTLSAKYKTDLRSKSDAQIAESVIAKEYERITRNRPIKPKLAYNYKINFIKPDFLQFKTKQLNDLLNLICVTDFPIRNGSPYIPEHINGGKYLAKIVIGNSTYKIKIGGIHSNESCQAIVSNEHATLIDADVASYYPNIILNGRLYPKHLGSEFLDIYGGIVAERLAAKKSGDKITADALKIVANGSFGKFGSEFSILYSPDLMLQVTLGGQLYLLMLIEHLEYTCGVNVISANTDGIVSLVPNDKKEAYDEACKQWQAITNFELEFTTYKALFSRDVNNYIAVKEDNKCKLKGAYSNHWENKKDYIFRFHKNPENLICINAVCDYITKGIQIEKTITECQDIKKFICIKNVKGGAQKDGIYLGKIVRWYYAKNEIGEILYKDNGNKVSLTEGAKPLMELPDSLPTDINYDRYIIAAYEILKDIGYYNQKRYIK